MTSPAPGARRRNVLWGVLVAVWLAFFGWYTSFGGPLTPEEIDGYVARMSEGERSPEGIAALRAFLEADTGDDFAMVNVIEFEADPGSVPGMPEGSSAEAILGRYMDYMWPALLRRACHPVLMGWAAAPALDLVGIEGAERWSQGAVMRYRSRRDMMEIAANPAFRDAHVFKLAAMAKTVAFPIDPWMHFGDPRLLLFLLLLVVGLVIDRAWGRTARDSAPVDAGAKGRS